MSINEQYKKDCKQCVLNNESTKQILSPGTTDRRWVPPGGLRKHNEKIHSESRRADHYENLPFSFSKPNKPKGQSVYVKCDNCGHVMSVTTVTVGIICPACHKFSTVTREEIR